MTWHIQYRTEAGDQIGICKTPEAAIEFACRLLDEGLEVFGLGVGELTDSISHHQIARIYGMWVRAKTPLGIVAPALRPTENSASKAAAPRR